MKQCQMSNIKCQIFGLLIAVLFLFPSGICYSQESTRLIQSETDSLLVYYETIWNTLKQQLKDAELTFIKTQGQIDLILYLIEERKKTLK